MSLKVEKHGGERVFVQTFEPRAQKIQPQDAVTLGIQRLAHEKLTCWCSAVSPTERLESLFSFKNEIQWYQDEYRDVINDFMIKAIQETPALKSFLASLQVQIYEKEWIYWAESVLDIFPFIAVDLILAHKKDAPLKTPKGMALELLDRVMRNDFQPFTKDFESAYGETLASPQQMLDFQRMLGICVTASFVGTEEREEIAARWRKMKAFFSSKSQGRASCLKRELSEIDGTTPEFPNPQSDFLRAFKAHKVQFAASPILESRKDSRSYTALQAKSISKKYKNPSPRLLLDAVLTESLNAPDAFSFLANERDCSAKNYCNFVISCMSQTLISSREMVARRVVSPKNAADSFLEQLTRLIQLQNEREEELDKGSYETILSIEINSFQLILAGLIEIINSTQPLLEQDAVKALDEKIATLDNETFWTQGLPFLRFLLPQTLPLNLARLIDGFANEGKYLVDSPLDSSQPIVKTMRAAYRRCAWDDSHTFKVTMFQIPPPMLSKVLSVLEGIVRDPEFQEGLLDFFEPGER